MSIGITFKIFGDFRKVLAPLCAYHIDFQSRLFVKFFWRKREDHWQSRIGMEESGENYHFAAKDI